VIHKRGSRVDDRPGAWDRGYDRKWERAAAQFRWRNPLCLGCLAIGVKRKAVVVDHVIPHRGDQRLFWQPHNWQSACAWHHNSIKPELERRYERKQIGAADLMLSSEVAVRLTRERYRPAVGLDGFAIAGS
jgi:5-methylcytosine-specific restriction enzyme A